MFDHGARGCFLQCFTGTVSRAFQVEVQRFVEELFFVSKSSVRASRGNTHGGRSFGKRSAGIPSAPEFLQSLFQGFLRIKSARTTNLRSGTADFHTIR